MRRTGIDEHTIHTAAPVEPGIRVIKAGEETRARTGQTAGILRREFVARPGVWMGVGKTFQGWRRRGGTTTATTTPTSTCWPEPDAWSMARAGERRAKPRWVI